MKDLTLNYILIPRMDKEREIPISAQETTREKQILIKEELETPRVPREVSHWIERVEKNIYLNKPITDDQTGQVVATSSQAKKPKIILPVTKKKFLSGMKTKTGEALRWLAELYFRLIKKDPERIVFKEDQSLGTK